MCIDLVKTEVNVKELQVVLSDESEICLVKRAKANFKTLGKRYGKQMKEIAAAIATLPQEQIAALERDGQLTLPLPSGEVVLELADVEIATEDMPGWLVVTKARSLWRSTSRCRTNCGRRDWRANW